MRGHDLESYRGRTGDLSLDLWSPTVLPVKEKTGDRKISRSRRFWDVSGYKCQVKIDFLR